MMAVAVDGAPQEAPRVAVASRPSHHPILAWLMTGSFLLVALAALVGHAVGFLPAHTYLHTVCEDGCALTPANAETLRQIGLSVAAYANIYSALQILFVLVCLGCGVLIVVKTPGQWVPLGIGYLLVGISSFEGYDYTALTQTYPHLASPIFLLGLPIGIFSGYALLTFPNGRFGSRWIFAYFVLSQATGFLPQSEEGFLGVLGFISWFIGFPIMLVIWLFRYRHDLNAREQRAMKWFMTSMSLFILAIIAVLLLTLFAPADSPAFLVINTVGFFGCGINIFGWLMGTLYANAFDIDVIISRTVVFGVLSAAVVGIYIVIVGYLGTAFHSGDNLAISLVAAGAVAILFQPLRTWLQRRVNRLLYGARDEPYHVLAQLDQQLALAMSPEEVLPSMVTRIATTLKLPYVAVELRENLARPGTSERVMATHGQPAAQVRRLPLAYQGETIGHLALAPRSGELALTKQDQRLLEDLAQHAGVIAHAVLLTDDLRRSRERIVVAREEERRRLRRDLHDGLGPMLASLPLTLAAAREYLGHDPGTTDALLRELTTQVQGAVTDVRRLVYELRPPALDDLGLIGALRDQATQFTQSGLRVCVLVPEPVGPLPAAVEVAAYRIAVEALTNTVRHAQAHTCTVTVMRDHDLILEVRDDGRGLPPHLQRGIGMRSMRERAEELGGTCQFTSAPDGGTHIVARLPLLLEVRDGGEHG